MPEQYPPELTDAEIKAVLRPIRNGPGAHKDIEYVRRRLQQTSIQYTLFSWVMNEDHRRDPRKVIGDVEKTAEKLTKLLREFLRSYVPPVTAKQITDAFGHGETAHKLLEHLPNDDQLPSIARKLLPDLEQLSVTAAQFIAPEPPANKSKEQSTRLRRSSAPFVTRPLFIDLIKLFDDVAQVDPKGDYYGVFLKFADAAVDAMGLRQEFSTNTFRNFLDEWHSVDGDADKFANLPTYFL
jgi:hypothetical protein